MDAPIDIQPISLVNNPVEASIAFNKRFEEFMRRIIYNKKGPLGNIKSV